MNVLQDKERMLLVGILSVKMAPMLDALAVPVKDQPTAALWPVAGIFAGYHFVAEGVQTYWPRIRARTLDKWFPPVAPVNPTSPATHP